MTSIKLSKRQLKFELTIVLALSLGASAIYSVLSLIGALLSPKGLAGSNQTLNSAVSSNPWLDTAYQLSGFAFNIAPAALAIYLLIVSNSQTLISLGLNFKKADPLKAVVLAASIGIPGIALYLAARSLGLAANVHPSNYQASALAIAFMVMAAIAAAVTEEVIVIGYLFDRLARLGFNAKLILILTSLLRGSYHLYQGAAGFFGNLVMGLVFGLAYKRWGRIMPLVIAHTIMDCVVF
ncbi:MAG: hypothetical protein RL556_621, partial [Actinomycetota bacterium]